MRCCTTIPILCCFVATGCVAPRVPTSALEERDEGDVYRTYERGKETPFSGIAYENYPDGQKKEETSYHDGRQEGRHRSWYPDGQLEEEIFMADGQWHGRMREWYRTGQLKFDVIQSHGAMNGTWREWHENGQLSVLAEMRKGLCIGACTMWFADGRKSIEYFHDMAGQETGGIVYHPNGKKALEYSVVLGVETTIGRWDENGNPIIEGRNHSVDCTR